jgi:hypothetical protein
MPSPRAGEEVEIRLHVDSDHAGGQSVRCSRTDFFVFFKFSATALVFKATTNRGDFGFWCRVRRA